MKQTKRKSRSPRNLPREQRLKNARTWLDQGWTKNIVDAYGARYNVSGGVARYERIELGYGDRVRIQDHERDGIEWEHKVDGYSGETKVVPKGKPDWELPLF